MQTLSEFLASDATYIFPAPGGSIDGRAATSDNGADLYLAEVAAMVKRRDMSRGEAMDALSIKIVQIQNQMHYGEAEDAKLIERIGEWIRDLAH